MGATAVATAFLVAAAATLVLLAFPLYTTAQFPPMLAPEPSSFGAEAPGPASLDCFSVLLNMSDCLSFVEAGSNLTKPDSPCCPELAGLVESNPVCLCQLLGEPEKVGIAIDVNKALKLPSACGISTPPVTVCAAIGIPVSVPTASEPAGSPEALASSPVGGAEGNGGQSIGASFITCFLAAMATMIFVYFF